MIQELTSQKYFVKSAIDNFVPEFLKKNGTTKSVICYCGSGGNSGGRVCTSEGLYWCMLMSNTDQFELLLAVI